MELKMTIRNPNSNLPPMATQHKAPSHGSDSATKVDWCRPSWKSYGDHLCIRLPLALLSLNTSLTNLTSWATWLADETPGDQLPAVALTNPIPSPSNDVYNINDPVTPNPAPRQQQRPPRGTHIAAKSPGISPALNVLCIGRVETDLFFTSSCPRRSYAVESQPGFLEASLLVFLGHVLLCLLGLFCCLSHHCEPQQACWTPGRNILVNTDNVQLRRRKFKNLDKETQVPVNKRGTC
jgi:hypothetical protein